MSIFIYIIFPVNDPAVKRIIIYAPTATEGQRDQRLLAEPVKYMEPRGGFAITRVRLVFLQWRISIYT